MKNSNKYNETDSLLANKLNNKILLNSRNQERSNSRLLNKAMLGYYNTFNSLPTKDKYDYSQHNLDSMSNINNNDEHFYDFNNNNLKFLNSYLYSKTIDIHKFSKSQIDYKNQKTFDSIDDDENNHKYLLQLNQNSRTTYNNPFIIKQFNINKIYKKTKSFKSNTNHRQNIHELMGYHSFPLEEKHQNHPFGNDIENNNDDFITNHFEKQISFCLEENGFESINFLENNSSKGRPPSRELRKSIYD